MRILVVEDESKLSDFVLQGLEAENFPADLAADGQQALELLTTGLYDLIVLDLMLPKIDGLSVLRRLREKKIGIPVLVLTARSSVEERIEGLEAGADDYVVKPFSLEELIARIRALLRRRAAPASLLRVADLDLDRSLRQVRRAGRPIQLTPKEYAILEFLMENAGHPVTRAMLFERVWSSRSEGLTNLVDVYVTHLRAKVDRDFEPKLIQTVRGVGYLLVDQHARP
jgi:DNA-binding response OmpR family regulator